MLILSFNELNLEDLNKSTFAINDEKIIRFSIDIKHYIICLGTERDDHIKQGEILLAQEENLEDLNEKEISNLLINHIMGGSIYFETLQKVFILLGGSSIEQALKLELGKKHSKESFAVCRDLVEKLFEKFYKNISIKINFN